MLYELIIQGENDRWETFRKAEREARRLAESRAAADGGRLRKLATRRRRRASETPQRAAA
jgi:hypothetical protein